MNESCFKYGSDECRHGFGLKNVGKALRELSIIDEHGNIHIKRSHAFVNDFHLCNASRRAMQS